MSQDNFTFCWLPAVFHPELQSAAMDALLQEWRRESDSHFLSLHHELHWLLAFIRAGLVCICTKDGQWLTPGLKPGSSTEARCKATEKPFPWSNTAKHPALLGENYCPLNQVWLQLGVKGQECQVCLGNVAVYLGVSWSTRLTCESCIVEKSHLGSFWKIWGLNQMWS